MGQLAKGTRGRTFTRIKDADSGSYGQYDIRLDARVDRRYYFRRTGSTDIREEQLIDFSRTSTEIIFNRCAEYDYDEQTILQRMRANEHDLVAEMIHNYGI